MATLSAADRQRISNGLQRYWSRGNEQVAGMVKSDLGAAIDATDDWIDANQAAYNTALPSAAQTNLSVSQKTLLFCVVAAMRVGVGFLRSLVGKVD